RRASEAGIVQIHVQDLREFTKDRHRTVDDRPFGGGEGMVLKPEPLFKCVESLNVIPREQRKERASAESVILLSPQGEMFTQAVAQDLAAKRRIVLICGRYEGVDERVAEGLADREISVGDYVLSGGELAAAVIVDTVTRLVPGALGNEASAQQESFTAARKAGGEGPDSTCGSGGLLDYPHYTRPAEFRGMAAPEVLIGGNHEQIRKWRRRKALEKTLRNRPDLLDSGKLSKEDKKLLEEIRSGDRF
ncbi:MAG TPA: tRNA (guanosine(37)-N1)-methyltransferase TrmD, partial [Candidatus Angelobacter sp.]|nr:tRNA (guanosine(37)-N1)-methyltransferase TrmD [Candidatus Angelobacter sp.]